MRTVNLSSSFILLKKMRLILLNLIFIKKFDIIIMGEYYYYIQPILYITIPAIFIIVVLSKSFFARHIEIELGLKCKMGKVVN